MADINHQTFELLRDTLDRIEKKVDDVDKQVAGGFEKMNGRVRKLENWRWYLMGLFGAGVVILQLIRK